MPLPSRQAASSDAPRVLVIAGEISGDMHAARVIAAVKRRWPEAQFFGIGGDQMRAVGVELRYEVKDMAVMGVTEVVKRFGFFRRVFKEMTAELVRQRPDAVLLVDYPGFNLRFAERVHRLGIRTIYYICPQVWAWRRGRIARMAATLDRLIVIFPFEPVVFGGTGLKVDFVGHPLVDEAERVLAEPLAKLPWKGEPRVALLPGSREHEIRRILPLMWSAAACLEREYPNCSFIIAAASPDAEAAIMRALRGLRKGPARWAVVSGQTRQVLRQARAAMVASGTATVEAALMLCPMIIVYKVASLTYLLGRMLVKVNHIGMVNIVAGQRVCPEFVQGAAKPEVVARALAPLLVEGPERASMLAELRQVKTRLGPSGGAERAAGIVVEELQACLRRSGAGRAS